MKKQTSLQDQIRKYYIVLTAAMLFVVSTVIAIVSVLLYWNDMSDFCEETLMMNKELIENRLTEIRNNQEILAKSASTREYSRYYQETAGADPVINLEYQHQIRGSFYLLSRNISTNSVYLVSPEGRVFYSVREMADPDATLRDQEWFTDITENMHSDGYVISDIHERPYMITNRANQVISMVRPVLEENSIQFKPLAYIIFDIDVARFLRQNENDMIRFTVFDQKGNMQTPANLILDKGQERAMMQLVTSGDFSRTVYDRLGFPRNILVHSDLEAFAIDLIGIRDLSALAYIMMVYLFVIVVVLGTALLLIWPISKKMANDILKPMAQLVRECNEVASGIKLEQFSEKESREIAFLSDTIENMVGRLSELTNQLAEEKVRLSEEEVRVLQHQINPHFINNTLQAMKALSLEGQSEKVSRIATMLGRFLNYAVYEPYQTVALETEVEYVKNYIELQNIRYNDRILFDCDLEEGTQGLMLPKMTLQPMIENCIHHGLGSEGTLTITVSAEIDARGIVVFIYDDGGGISEEKLAEIRENLTVNNVYKNNRSIGIVNVNERLYRRFGEAYQMDIRSHTGYGTTIIMNFPLPKEMEENT